MFKQYNLDDFEGAKAAGEHFRQVFLSGRGPQAPPWEELRPDWARGTDDRAYYWKAGFCRFWNYLANKHAWPEWAKMRLIFSRNQGEGSGAD